MGSCKYSNINETMVTVGYSNDPETGQREEGNAVSTCDCNERTYKSEWMQKI